MKTTFAMLCVVLFTMTFSVDAQATSVPPIPTSTPDLVGTLAAQGTEITALSTRTALDVEKAELHADQGDLNLLAGSIAVLAAATIVAVLGGLYGLKSGRDVKQQVEEYTQQIKQESEKKIRETLDESFFRADARTRLIYVPNRPDFAENVKSLKTLGFQRLREYSPADFSTLHDLQNGAIVIYPAKSLADVEDLERMLVADKLSWAHIGFIIYTLGRIDGANTITENYPTAILVNSTAAMITNLYALARILL